ncbi:indolepyruvate oxidoreductase subunit beta [Pelotomaculum schinkii]|uniref:Indolepyruvate oxidoreductase subunit beta n=1 Tax=Pelotomaculum schinkii TaxID=78350 RepID=A0A4Y7R9J1_9FIRM|nr:indolepyruvate oxidoreductase subunit beta [Pelotomaculum schinkii]TEB05353.1 indolepyruvate oxidoreductase subunit beta [Pelotomaculum schinkii]
MKLDIVISGVGGQGSVLASRALAGAGMGLGLDVRTSEIIGMAQREGSVTSQVRIGEQLFGATIPDHEADILLGFELAETIRALPKLKPGGVIIASSSAIVPVSVQLGISSYDREAMRRYLREQPGKVVLLDLDELAKSAGNIKTGNVIILGALSTLPGLPFEPEQLQQAVLNLIPEKLQNTNKRAFEVGRRAMEVA